MAGDKTIMQPTQKAYLADTYCFRAKDDIHVLDAATVDQRDFVILDRTIFHPQGGGQPADEGSITVYPSDNGEAEPITFQVETVRERDGVIYHYGAYTGDLAGRFQPGASVELRVDETRRQQNAQLHSAGHLIDAAMTRLGYSEDIRPSKGYHFQDGPYVEYIGTISPNKKSGDALLSDLNACLAELIAESTAVKVHNITKEHAAEKLGVSLHDTAHLSDNRDVRIVNVGGQACPCGGTHVRNTQELGQVEVTRVKARKNVLKISYRVLGGGKSGGDACAKKCVEEMEGR